MALPQATATFPGIDSILGVSFDLTHGISPGVATLTIAPQRHYMAQGGTLTLFYNATRITFSDCKVNAASVQRNDSGEIWQVSIFDRRWKWRFGSLWGRYNLRKDKDDGTYVGHGTEHPSEKTPRELAKLCLEAMGERGYDVGDIPNDTRPEVEWDFDNPAECLAELCDQLGCRVVLDLDNRVHIRRAGVGASLPIGRDVVANAVTADPKEIPDQIAIVTGRARYQVDLPLEAVGMDTDGQVKLIDQLSYKPTGGWAGKDPFPYFTCVTASDKARDLAANTVYRWYRVKVSASSPIEIPGFGKVTDLADLLPIEQEQIDTELVNGESKNKAAQIYGVFFPDKDGLSNSATSCDPSSIDTQSYMRPFSENDNRSYSIDTERGIVMFNSPVYRNTETGTPTKLTIGEATLRLRTSVCARQKGTRAPMRYVRTMKTGGRSGTLAHCERHDEITRTAVPTYSGTQYRIVNVTTNEKYINRECDYYLKAMLKEYENGIPQTVTYAGLKSIRLDGAIQQVGWQFGGGSATTTACRNSELVTRVIPYKERRSLERKRKDRTAAQSTKPAAKRRERKREGR